MSPARRPARRPLRRLARAAALLPAGLVLAATAPALAVPPEGWPEREDVSTLWVLVLMVLVPLGLIALISLLAYLPSIVRGEKYTPGLAWRNEPEWFGGPSAGVEAADAVEPKQLETAGRTRGGASARW